MKTKTISTQSQDRAVTVAFANSGEFRSDFCAWLFDNLPIYKEFERQSLAVAARRSHYGARTVMEVVRHNSILIESDGGWKINNNKTPDCARLFAMLNPNHADLFSFRDSSARIAYVPEDRRAA
jgi:hypothetical protein